MLYSNFIYILFYSISFYSEQHNAAERTGIGNDHDPVRQWLLAIVAHSVARFDADQPAGWLAGELATVDPLPQLYREPRLLEQGTGSGSNKFYIKTKVLTRFLLQ